MSVLAAKKEAEKVLNNEKIKAALDQVDGVTKLLEFIKNNTTVKVSSMQDVLNKYENIVSSLNKNYDKSVIAQFLDKTK